MDNGHVDYSQNKVEAIARQRKMVQTRFRLSLLTDETIGQLLLRSGV